VFSQADYSLAARMLGLPEPRTPDEQAAAAPMTARVLRDLMQMRPPGIEEGMQGQPNANYIGATRSLNNYPNNDQPETKAQLESRLRVETEDPAQDEYLIQLLMMICEDPMKVGQLLEMLEEMQMQEDCHTSQLSSQRPAEYDTPNMGSNYSMLNAPSSNGIPPSVQYQQLS